MSSPQPWNPPWKSFRYVSVLCVITNRTRQLSLSRFSDQFQVYVSRLGSVLPASAYLHTPASLNTDPTNATTTPKAKSGSSEGVVRCYLVDIAQREIAMCFELLSVTLLGHHIGDILASADIYQSDNVFHTLL
jgi:hypothetical protein